MKMTSSTRMIVAILVVVAVAVAFWMLFLGPKRKEADELSTQVEGLQATLAQSQADVADAEAARREFPQNYQQLVVLGKAVPANDETASLLVQLNHVADRSKINFNSIEVGTANGSAATEETAAPATESATPGTEIPPTEAEASLLPIGATVGPAGLSILPYEVSFDGSFFDVNDFIEDIDSMVNTGGPTDSKVTVDGRLVTLDGFSLSADPVKGFPFLEANFSVTTYLVPPSQGVTAGATPTEPAEATEEVAPEGETTEEAPAEEGTTEGTPSSSTEEAK
jgi:Tfp pilus assembly protein PilO